MRTTGATVHRRLQAPRLYARVHRAPPLKPLGSGKTHPGSTATLQQAFVYTILALPRLPILHRFIALPRPRASRNQPSEHAVVGVRQRLARVSSSRHCRQEALPSSGAPDP
mmetsp:Transcript_6762/g.20493  ORF Transcript_6762/g.20493 Transcript_6762/m.20493 type:complete len:111 (-) Transcript_6762:226-558(-)|eukprot:scaffold120342_cov26-Tisochrysis_lutea.AAC.1